MRVHFETPLVSQKMADLVLSILLLIQKILHSMWFIFQMSSEYLSFEFDLVQSWAWAQHHTRHLFWKQVIPVRSCTALKLSQDLVFISLPISIDHGKQSQPFLVQNHLQRIVCIRNSRCEIFLNLFCITVPTKGERWDSGEGWGSIQGYCSIGLQENMDDKQQLDWGAVT